MLMDTSSTAPIAFIYNKLFAIDRKLWEPLDLFKKYQIL